MGITAEQEKGNSDVYNQNSRFLQDMSLVPGGTEKDSEKGESIGTLRKPSGSMKNHSNTLKDFILKTNPVLYHKGNVMMNLLQEDRVCLDVKKKKHSKQQTV